MKNIILSVFGTLVLYGLKAQTQFCFTVGGAGNDEGHSIIQTSDGGYAIGGYTNSFGAGNNDVYVIKLDANGNLQWTKTIGGNNNDAGESIIQTTDGGYIIVGTTSSFGAGNGDIYLIKLDVNGNIQWTKIIGGSGNDGGTSITQTSDGGYVIGGNTTSFGAGGFDVYVVKLNISGNVQWTKTIGLGGDADQGYSIIQTSDGGYAITGMSFWFAGSYSIYVVKLDASGNLQWTKGVGASSEIGYSINQTMDGGYVIGGGTSTFGAGVSDVYAIKLDASGNLQWTKTIGGSMNESGRSIIQASDGSYVISGMTQSFSAGYYDIYIVKIDANGNLQWTNSSGGSGGSDRGYSIIQTTDGGYVVCGMTDSFGAGGSDVYMVKLDASGNGCCTTGSGGLLNSGGSIVNNSSSLSSGGNISNSIDIVSSGGILNQQCSNVSVFEYTSNQHILVYPNPASNKIFIEQYYNAKEDVNLFDVYGKIVRKQLSSNSHTTEMDVSSLSEGIYFVQIKTSEGVITKKIIVQR